MPNFISAATIASEKTLQCPKNKKEKLRQKRIRKEKYEYAVKSTQENPHDVLRYLNFFKENLGKFQRSTQEGEQQVSTVIARYKSAMNEPNKDDPNYRDPTNNLLTPQFEIIKIKKKKGRPRTRPLITESTTQKSKKKEKLKITEPVQPPTPQKVIPKEEAQESFDQSLDQNQKNIISLPPQYRNERPIESIPQHLQTQSADINLIHELTTAQCKFALQGCDPNLVQHILSRDNIKHFQNLQDPMLNFNENYNPQRDLMETDLHAKEETESPEPAPQVSNPLPADMTIHLNQPASESNPLVEKIQKEISIINAQKEKLELEIVELENTLQTIKSYELKKPVAKKVNETIEDILALEKQLKEKTQQAADAISNSQTTETSAFKDSNKELMKQLASKYIVKPSENNLIEMQYPWKQQQQQHQLPFPYPSHQQVAQENFNLNHVRDNFQHPFYRERMDQIQKQQSSTIKANPANFEQLNVNSQRTSLEPIKANPSQQIFPFFSHPSQHSTNLLNEKNKLIELQNILPPLHFWPFPAQENLFHQQIPNGYHIPQQLGGKFEQFQNKLHDYQNNLFIGGKPHSSQQKQENHIENLIKLPNGQIISSHLLNSVKLEANPESIAPVDTSVPVNDFATAASQGVEAEGAQKIEIEENLIIEDNDSETESNNFNDMKQSNTNEKSNKKINSNKKSPRKRKNTSFEYQNNKSIQSLLNDPEKKDLRFRKNARDGMKILAVSTYDQETLQKRMQFHNQLKIFMLQGSKYILERLKELKNEPEKLRELYDSPNSKVEQQEKYVTAFKNRFTRSDLSSFLRNFKPITAEDLLEIKNMYHSSQKQSLRSQRRITFIVTIIQTFDNGEIINSILQKNNEKFFEQNTLTLSDYLLENPRIVELLNEQIVVINSYNRLNRIFMLHLYTFIFPQLACRKKADKLDQFYSKNYVLSLISNPELIE